MKKSSAIRDIWQAIVDGFASQPQNCRLNPLRVPRQIGEVVHAELARPQTLIGEPQSGKVRPVGDDVGHRDLAKQGLSASLNLDDGGHDQLFAGEYFGQHNADGSWSRLGRIRPSAELLHSLGEEECYNKRAKHDGLTHRGKIAYFWTRVILFFHRL